MRALIQRVIKSKVIVDNQTVGKIGKGLLVLLAVGKEDTLEDVEWLASKIIQMRIFSDENGKMNKSVVDVNGEILVVSQFTLYASTKKGNRPSFTESAPPDMAKHLYEKFIEHCEKLMNKRIQTGVFAADMKVHLINDGPVTIWMDSKNKE
ncbi:MAG: D-aminoacyl-tRNA deacylase [Bacteroidia bacterium]|nr:MAG: D-aminoacyl-tRNA deacylase [Bacteroidia bacterium]